MSRILSALAALLASVALAGAALAQATPGAAPPVHPGTKLSFPPTLGGATLVQSYNYGADGMSYHYVLPSRMEITVHVFDGGRRVPNGSSHPAIINQFATELATAQQQLQSAGLQGFERPSVPSACAYGNVTFRCITYSANAGGALGGRYFGKLLLIGYREYFVKILVSWAQNTAKTAADADHELQAFVPALFTGGAPR
jgi:hypothetical protein